jgi:hypothetical protein
LVVKEVDVTKTNALRLALSAAIAASFAVAVAPRKASAEEAAAPTEVKIGGWIETYYQANLNGPTNGITSLRPFDYREGFNLQNAAVDVDVKRGASSMKVTLQSGLVGVNSYDPLEPTSTGTAYNAASGANALRYVQQAYAAHAFENGLTLTGGLFATPVGYETYNVKDNWNWSRANTFYFLTYYHVGAKAAYALNKEFAVAAYLVNGWNNGFETNSTPSGALQLTYDDGSGTTGSVVYFVGNERKRGETGTVGRPLRHMVDAWITKPLNDSFAVGLHGNVGMENNDVGKNQWLATAAYARAKLSPWMFLAARGDVFRENAADPAAPLFFLSANGTEWVASGTLTLDMRPTDNTSFRIEGRYDRADGDVFFKQSVPDSGGVTNVFNTRAQKTLLIGMNTTF